jgi:phytoene desaturase
VVVGAGVAGLAAAVRLAAAGWRVTVLEAADGPGGKLREARWGGCRFDLGPSLFTWPALVEEVDACVREAARAWGEAWERRLPPAFAYRRLDRSTHYHWPDGRRWVAWADPARRREGLAPDEVEALEGYLEDSARVFEATRGVFLEHSIHEWGRNSGRRLRAVLPAWRRIPWLGTLHQLNARRLRGDHWVQLFDRYATYNGSDPFRAPAMMQVIPHLEYGMGTFYPEGGMYSITRHLHALGEALGVEYHFETAAERILHDGKAVNGVRDVRGRVHSAQVVLSGADLHPTYRKLLPDLKAPERILSQPRSTSGVIFYWKMAATFPELHLHNIFFSDDYAREFAEIQQDGMPVSDATVYVNITSKLTPEDAPEGCENWFVLINVAARETPLDAAAVGQIRNQTLRRIEQSLRAANAMPSPLPLESLIVGEEVLTPQEIEQHTGSWQGALYGAASNSPLSAFLRHRNRSTDLQGLYFCGGSVHPGGGIPLCLLSARITAELVAEGQRADHRRDRNALGVIGILHAVGILGIAAGFAPFLLRFTPLTLLIAGGLALRSQWRNAHLGWLAVAAGGFVAEVIGVQTGWLFGDYAYGTGLGPRFLGVPWLLGWLWLIMLLGTHALTEALLERTGLPRLAANRWVRAAGVATTMTALDFLLEPVAVRAGWWTWAGDLIPAQNYLSWWGTSFLLSALCMPQPATRPSRMVAIGLMITFALFFLTLICLSWTP